ncbi:MAG: autotransporter outer membrane beta-barrel domain-containing protein [Pseudomonadota bacterium]
MSRLLLTTSTVALAALLFTGRAAAQDCMPETPMDGDEVICVPSDDNNSPGSFDLLAHELSVTIDQTDNSLPYFLNFRGQNSTTIVNSNISDLFLEYLNPESDDTLVLNGNATLLEIDFAGGNNTLINRGFIDSSVSLLFGEGDDTFINDEGGSVEEDVFLRDGDNTFENRGTIDRAVDVQFGAGDDTLVFSASGENENDFFLGDGDNTISVFGEGVRSLIEAGNGDDYLIANSGSRLFGFVDLGDGDNLVEIATGASSSGNIRLGNGDNRLDIEEGGRLDGSVSFVAGDTSINIAGTFGDSGSISINEGNSLVSVTDGAVFAGVSRAFGEGQHQFALDGGTFTGEYLVFGNGNGLVDFEAAEVARGSILLGDGNDVATFTNSQVAENVFVNSGDGDDQVVIDGGLFGASIDLGVGNDTLIIESGTEFTGSADGGSAIFPETETDTLLLRAEGATLSQFNNFQTIEVDTGTEFRTGTGPGFLSNTIGNLSVLSGSLRNDIVVPLTGLTLATGVDISGAGTFLFQNGGTVSLPSMVTPSDSTTINGLPLLLVFEGADVDLTSTSTLNIGFLSTDDLDPLQTAGLPGLPGADEDPRFLANGLFIRDGALNLNGGALSLIANGSTQIFGEETISIATATEGITGSFGSTSITGNFLISDIRIDGTSLLVDIRSQIGANATLTTSAGLYAAYLDELSITSTQETTEDLIRDVLAVEDETALETLLRGLSAEPYASMDLINTSLAFSIKSAVGTGGTGRRRSYTDGRFEAWTAAFLDDTSQDGVIGGVSGADVEHRGGLVGAGYRISEQVTAGAFAGVSSFELDFTDLASQIDGDTFTFGGYARIDNGPVRASFMLARASGEADITRVVPVLDESVLGQTDLSATIASVDVAYDLPLATANIMISPLVGLTYVSSTRDETNEATNPVIQLEVDDQDTRFVFADLGVSFRPQTGLADNRVFPSVSGGYRYEVLGNDSETFARLAGENTSVLTPGLDAARGRGFVNAAIAGAITDAVSISIGYNGEFGDGLTRHNAQVGLVGRF